MNKFRSPVMKGVSGTACGVTLICVCVCVSMDADMCFLD